MKGFIAFYCIFLTKTLVSAITMPMKVPMPGLSPLIARGARRAATGHFSLVFFGLYCFYPFWVLLCAFVIVLMNYLSL